VGSGDLATVTGYYRPGRRGLPGWVEFHSGEISPGQSVMSRLSESLLLNEEWWGVMEWKWGIVPHPHYLLPSPRHTPPALISI
jgi:hypothetical protein